MSQKLFFRNRLSLSMSQHVAPRQCDVQSSSYHAKKETTLFSTILLC